MSNVINLRTASDRKSLLNVLGQPLDLCSCEPMTGWLRDGRCSTDDSDKGHHTVCCVMSDEFLVYSKEQGNDLSTPMPEHGFPGLKAGDHWCLCSLRWKDAFEEGKAPKVVLASTHLSTLSVVGLAQLQKMSF